MFNRSMLIILGVMALLASSSAAWAEDLVANPAYTYWAQYKPGTFVTMTTSMQMNLPKEEGMDDATRAAMAKAMQSTMTRTLKDITPEQATVETTTNVMGRAIAHSQVIPAKVAKEKADGPLIADDKMAKATISDMKTGTDTIEIAGKKLDCTTQEFTATSDTSLAHIKVWINKEIPGGAVKMVNTMEKPMAGVMTMVVTDYKVVK